jgi:hypothetical protein
MKNSGYAPDLGRHAGNEVISNKDKRLIFSTETERENTNLTKNSALECLLRRQISASN